ncbi:MAG: DUF2442 domain-containing protein [Bacteroidales bacterium]|nr:DUF2442 domain-containing protein [Bacteroidales bacterium]
MNTTVKTPWDKVTKILINNQKQYNIFITTDSGKELEINLTPLVSRQIFWRLRTPRYFKMIKIDPLGGLYWPQGEDIAPEKVLDYAVKYE